MAPKRKARTLATVPSKSTKRTANGIATHTPTIQFLDFPAELREALYSSIAPNISTVWVLPKGRGYVLSAHPLHLTCKQINREFSSTLRKFAPVTAKAVIAEVVDFDFRAPHQLSQSCVQGAEYSRLHWRSWAHSQPFHHKGLVQEPRSEDHVRVVQMDQR